MSESCRSDRDRPSTACPEAGVEEEENNKSALSSDLPSSQSESREIQSSLEQAGPNKDLDNYASSPDEIERQDPLEQLAQDSGAEETSPRGEDGMSKEPIKQSDEVRARDTASPEIEMKRPASPEKVLEVDQNPNEPPEHPNPGSPEVSDMEATSEAEASSEIKEETGEESDANFVPEEQFDFEAVKEEMLFNEQDEDFDSTGNGPDPLAQESIKEEIKMEEQEYPPGLVPLPLPDVSDSEDRIEITDDWQESLSPRSTCSLTMHACTFPNCPKYFSKKSRLEIHFRTHTSEKPFVCDVEGCSAAYARKEHLRRHKENTHKSERWEYKCSKCPKKYMNSYSLRVHFKTKHEDGAASRFKCEQCGEEFDKNNQYQRHLAGHSGLKPYPCDLCDKRFLYPNKLRLHLLTHSKTHSCTVCEEKFNDFQAVRKHMAMTHNKVKPCVHCGKEFKSRSLMNDHMRTHDTVRTAFECPEENCDKSFLHERNLRVHIRTTHFGQRFICTFEGCSQTLATFRGLKHHMKLHEERGLKIRDESFFNKKTTPRRPRKDKGIPRLPAAAGLANVDVKAKSLKVINEQFSGERSLDVQAIEQELNANPALILDMDAVYASEEDSTDYRAGEICRKHYSNVEKQRQGEKKDLEYLLGNVIKKPSDDVQ